MNIIQQIGEAVRVMRLQLGMTSSDVAQLAQVSPSILSALENGRRTDLSLAMAERICDTVGIEISLVFRGQQQPLALPTATRQRVRRRS